ncbi:unnamed protein product [Brachionus calyciflorus]|uniref:Pleckstrin homology domain-containing family A member 8 n=1 Tax=Brachionus calyciflorus TaxID=104777 RepID=A0A813X9A1_9BILA|nr:unnamed protein product [Brachionus calyciflorus]
MEGYLHKWTNYLKGWQLRYFVLKDGILSYYNTENDSQNGDCKRSYKIFMFDIMVNKSDKTRVDLILPNEHNLFLRASDYKERQKWLVALASQKATYPSNFFQNTNSSENIDALMKQSNMGSPNESTIGGTYDSTYFLKLKQSELKLYCDLLTQQTHDFKNLIVDLRKTVPADGKDDNNLVPSTSTSYNSVMNETFTESPNEIDIKQSNQNETTKESDDEPTDIKKLDEMSSNINVTCDMLAQIVRNLIVLSNTSTNISPEAVKSLLNETEAKTKESTDINYDLDQYKYHLYHPLYLNQQLNQYKTKSIPIAMSSQSTKSHNSLNSFKISNENLPRVEILSTSLPTTNSLSFLTAKMKSIDSNNNNNNHNKTSINKRIRHKIPPNNHNHFDKVSFISKNFIIRNYHIENLKETALLACADPVAEQLSHNSAENNYSEKDFSKNMIETSVETVVVTSGHFPSITIVGESHKTNLKNHDISKSFFTIIKHRFSDIVLLENNGIPTEYFLNCCSDVFSLLDSFGSTAFLPVKIDVYGNINKIKQKYLVDPVKYKTLQAIIQHEINDKTTHAKNSATDALMWLRRAVWFLREFLSNFSKSMDSVMSECVHISYQKTLKQYHNFVVKSIFSLAMRALPSKDEFYKRLVADHSVYLNNKSQFEHQVMEEMKVTVKGIDRVIDLIKDFYLKNKLDV